MATNVIPFRLPADKKPLIPFAPGVVPFDRGNPTHVAAWNAMCALGEIERKAKGQS